MDDLKKRLLQCDLTQYYEAFVLEGFYTWESLLDISECDL